MSRLRTTTSGIIKNVVQPTAGIKLDRVSYSACKIVYELSEDDIQITEIVCDVCLETYESYELVQDLLFSVGCELFPCSTDFSWGRLVAYLIFCRKLALHSRDIGGIDYSAVIVEYAQKFVTQYLLEAIAQHGGWVSLYYI